MNEEIECERIRPQTMAYQRCWLPRGHEGPHRCQGYPMYSDWTDRESEQD